jgi:RHS repeat-associated protein
MAAKRTYNTLNGRIRSETDVSGTKVYVTDALGSVTGVSQSGTISGAARYSPYGRVITGVSGAALNWLGVTGYYPSGRVQASFYVRARHFCAESGRWNSVDRLWPKQQPYRYSNANPVTYVDPSGLYAIDYGSCNTCASQNPFWQGLSGRISQYMQMFCKKWKERGGGHNCILRCAYIHNVSLDVECLDKLCSWGSVDPRITCRYCDPTKILLKCPKGSYCRHDDTRVPPCAQAKCEAGGEGGTPGDINICCGIDSELVRKRCCCLGHVTLNCDDLQATLYHEILHSCGPDCNDDDDPAEQGRNNNFAACVIDKCTGRQGFV